METDDKETGTSATVAAFTQRATNNILKRTITEFTTLGMEDLSAFDNQTSLPCGPSKTQIGLWQLDGFAPGESLTEPCIDAYLGVLAVLYPGVKCLSWDESQDILDPQGSLEQAEECFGAYLGREDKRVLVPIQDTRTWGFIYIDGTQTPISVQCAIPLHKADVARMLSHLVRIRKLCMTDCADSSSPFFGSEPPERSHIPGTSWHSRSSHTGLVP